MLQILKAKLQRAEHQERLAELLSMRKGHVEDTASGLLPGPSWKRMAEEIGAPVHNLIAVFNVESRGGGFDDQGRLTVLYETHVAYDHAARPKEAHAQAPLLFTPYYWDPDDTPKNKFHPYRLMKTEEFETLQDKRWDMIARAAKIDFNAAICGTSWGRFQVMGYHGKTLGFRDPMHMIEHMYEGEENHFDVFVRYVRVNGLLKALQRGDWWAFSRYNSGRTDKRKKYAAKCLAEANRAKELLA